MGHRLANNPYKNPFIAFTEIINQIDSYGKLILIMMENFCYMTVLMLDIIGSRVSWRRLFTQIIGGASYPVWY